MEIALSSLRAHDSALHQGYVRRDGSRSSTLALAIIHQRYWGLPWYWPEILQLDGSYPCDIGFDCGPRIPGGRKTKSLWNPRRVRLQRNQAAPDPNRFAVGDGFVTEGYCTRSSFDVRCYSVSGRLLPGMDNYSQVQLVCTTMPDQIITARLRVSG